MNIKMNKLNKYKLTINKFIRNDIMQLYCFIIGHNWFEFIINEHYASSSRICKVCKIKHTVEYITGYRREFYSSVLDENCIKLKPYRK